MPSPTTSPWNTTRKVCKTFIQKQPCQFLPLKKKKPNMPMIAAKASLLLTQRRWKLLPQSKRNNFLVRDRREWHRQVLRGKINRFPTTSTLDLPLGYPSALLHLVPNTVQWLGSSIVSNGCQNWTGKSKPTDRQQQGDGWEEKCHQAEIYRKYQSPTTKERVQELQVWSKTPGTSNTTKIRAFPAGDNHWSLVIQSWASAP